MKLVLSLLIGSFIIAFFFNFDPEFVHHHMCLHFFFFYHKISHTRMINQYKNVIMLRNFSSNFMMYYSFCYMRINLHKLKFSNELNVGGSSQ